MQAGTLSLQQVLTVLPQSGADGPQEAVKELVGCASWVVKATPDRVPFRPVELDSPALLPEMSSQIT